MNDSSIDIVRAAVSLFKRWEVAQAEMEKLVLCDPSSRAFVFLLMLQKRGERGFRMLKGILEDPSLRGTHDVQLPHQKEQTSEGLYSKLDSRSLQITKVEEPKSLSAQLSDEVERDGLPQINGSASPSVANQVKTARPRHQNPPVRSANQNTKGLGQDFSQHDSGLSLTTSTRNGAPVIQPADLISAENKEPEQMISRGQDHSNDSRVMVKSSSSVNVANGSTRVTSDQIITVSSNGSEEVEVSSSLEIKVTQQEKEEPKVSTRCGTLELNIF